MDNPISDTEYFHFNTHAECDAFVQLLTSANIPRISHKCCGGLGCGVYSHDLPLARDIFAGVSSVRAPTSTPP